MSQRGDKGIKDGVIVLVGDGQIRVATSVAPNSDPTRYIVETMHASNRDLTNSSK